MAEAKNLGCNYAGHEFGASYPDSMCIDGYLWDADSDDGDGMLSSGGEWACPRCNTAEYLAEALEEAKGGACGRSNGRSWIAADQWERACAKAQRENAETATAFLATIEPFETSDWPDRQAVIEGRARWDDTITVTYLGATRLQEPDHDLKGTAQPTAVQVILGRLEAGSVALRRHGGDYPPSREERAEIARTLDLAADRLSRIQEENERLRAEQALADETLGLYATDEDEYLSGDGEPYGSIPTEAGMFARSRRRRHQEREASLASREQGGPGHG